MVMNGKSSCDVVLLHPQVQAGPSPERLRHGKVARETRSEATQLDIQRLDTLRRNWSTKQGGISSFRLLLAALILLCGIIGWLLFVA
jgi:hypothetical protein